MPLEGSPHPSQFRCRHHTKSRLIQTSLQLPLLITGFITRGFRSNDSSVCEWLFELLLRLLEHFFTPDDVYEWIGTLQDCGSRDKSIRCLRGGVEGEIEALWWFLAQLARIALETSSRSVKTKIRPSGRIQQVNASLTSKTEPNHCDGAEGRSAKAFHTKHRQLHSASNHFRYLRR